MARWIGFSLLLTVFAVAAYQTARVLHARSVAEERFDRILAAEPLAISDISERRLRWLVKIEDPDFYAHRGVDMKTPGAGLTTITQGLVKRVFFKEFQPGWRKIEQSLIARFAVTPKISKNRQLAALFEIAYLGVCDDRHMAGFSMAAQCYYDAPLRVLTDDQYLSLVAMLVGPNAYHPVNHPQRLAGRLARIKRYLAGDCAPLTNGDVYYEACSASKLRPVSQ